MQSDHAFSFSVVLAWVALVLSVACSRDINPERVRSLSALAEKVRDKRETTKIAGDVALRLGLRDREEEIPAHGQLVLTKRQNKPVEYWSLTQLRSF